MAMASLLILLICAVHLLPCTVYSVETPMEAYPSSSDSCRALNGEDEDNIELFPVRKEVYGGGRIFDISHSYREDMPSFGSKEGLGKFLWLPASMKNGSLANNSEMKMPTHTGTHVDAPGHVFDHYFDAGFDVDTLDLDVLNGMFDLICLL